MAKLPDVLIWTVKERLSDGSEVFNVHLPEQVLHAITLEDAVDLAEKIMDAVNQHTNETADVMEG